MAQIVAKQVSFYSSITLANWGGGGAVLLCADSADCADTWGGSNYENSWHNTWRLPKKNNIIVMKLLNTWDTVYL